MMGTRSADKSNGSFNSDVRGSRNLRTYFPNNYTAPFIHGVFGRVKGWGVRIRFECFHMVSFLNWVGLYYI